MKKKLLAGMFAASMLLGNFLFTPTVEAEIQTYVGTGEYIMSDYETPVAAKERARARALTNAQEQAGVYVERHLKVSNHKVDSDVINVITKGIVNVIGDVKYTQTPIDEGGGSYQITATVRVNIDSDDIDKWFAKDEQERETLIEQNKELQRSNAEKEKEIERLKKQIATVKTEAEQDRLTTQFKTTDKEFLSNQKLAEGDKLFYEQNYNEAIGAYKEAIKLNPYNFLSYFGRGKAYMNLKQYNYALSDFTKAIKLNPYNSSSYLCRGVIYRDIKQYNRALADFTKAIKLDSNSVLSYLIRGALYMNVKQYNLALADFTEAVRLDSNYALSYLNRGVAYIYLKQYNLALADFNKTIELEPNNALAYYSRGYVYNGLGDTVRAEADFAKARELGYNG